MNVDLIEVGKGLSEAGLTFALAAVVIYWYRIDSRERLENAEKRAKEAEARTAREREDKLLLVEIVRANTQAMTRLEVAIMKQEQREVRKDARERDES